MFPLFPLQDMEIGLQPTQESRAEGRVDDSRPEHKGRAPKAFEGIDRLLAVGRKGGAETKEEEEKEEAKTEEEEGTEHLGRKEAIVFQQVSGWGVTRQRTPAICR